VSLRCSGDCVRHILRRVGNELVAAFGAAETVIMIDVSINMGRVCLDHHAADGVFQLPGIRFWRRIGVMRMFMSMVVHVYFPEYLDLIPV
jgi:hypothetical protein